MSDEKIKVRDIAALFVDCDPKNVLNELKGMGFEVKVSTSSLSAYELPRIKNHLKSKGYVEQNATEDDASKKATPSVLVRRKRVEDKKTDASTDAPTSSPTDAANEPSKTPRDFDQAEEQGTKSEEKKEAIAKEDTPSSQKDEAPTPKSTAHETEAASAAPKQQEESPKKAVRTEKPDTATAKIISKPEPVAPIKVEQKEEVKEDHPHEADDTKHARDIVRPDATFEPNADDIAATKLAVAAALAPAKREDGSEASAEAAGKPQPEPHTPGQARIISRPAPVARTLPEPEIAETTILKEKAGAKFETFPGAKTGDFTSERDDTPKKRRGMGTRRTVDFKDFEDDSLALGGSVVEKEDLGEDSWGDSAQRTFSRRPKRRGSKRTMQQTTTQPLKAAKRKVRMEEFIKVGDLAHEMGVKGTAVIKVLMHLGTLATINQSLDLDTATLVASEFEYEVEKVGFSEDTYLISTTADSPEDLLPRPPVVTIMGHVDHGKTSLLDAIRKSSVAEGEAGGITQHIGAYHVTTPKGDIVFLDTPGHEAFTAMRARGAQITDIVVLVVAADDGVMEQTREAVSHSQAAGVPIMVAVNKIDKEGANPERVQRELSDIGLVPEDWGGETIFVNVSAKTGEGIDGLLEVLALQAEVMELRANPNKPARGHVVEARLDKGRGPIATILVQEGTLKPFDCFVCGIYSGRVRAMQDEHGKPLALAGPSIPVEVHGFEGVPEAGEEFASVADEKVARRIADERAIKQRERELAKESKVTLETFLASRPSDLETLVLNLIVKADVQGSLEAITEALKKLSNEKVRVNVVFAGAASITESDVLLASASNAIIIGFNVRPTAKVKDLAEQEKVEIRFYDIIYNLSDEVKNAMEGMLAPIVSEVYLGQAEVRQTFGVPKFGTIAGCFVVDGKITRNAEIRLLREGVVIYTGKINSLKRFKDDAREVMKGYECGLSLENFNDIKDGDVIEAFEHTEKAATL